MVCEIIHGHTVTFYCKNSVRSVPGTNDKQSSKIMIEINEISPGKRTIFILSTILLFSIVFAVIINKDTGRMQSYYRNTTEITYKDSIDLEVNEVWLNHDYLYFNDKYYLFGSRVIQTGIDFFDIMEFTTPFTVIKSAFSDSLILLHAQNKYLLILESKN